MKQYTEKEIEESKNYPKGVHLCSTTNSTPFTNCCDVAILEEEKCPSCGLYVVGFEKPRGLRRDARFDIGFRPFRKALK